MAEEIGLNVVRAPTVGTHPAFVAMIRELIEERLSPDVPDALSASGPEPRRLPAGLLPPGHEGTRARGFRPNQSGAWNGHVRAGQVDYPLSTLSPDRASCRL